MADKIYCGNAKEIVFNGGGSSLDVTLDIDTIREQIGEYGFKTKNGKSRLKINISRRRNEDAYGNTHIVTINTWKPSNNNVNQQNEQHSQNNFEDNIPF